MSEAVWFLAGFAVGAGVMLATLGLLFRLLLAGVLLLLLVAIGAT